MKKIFISGLVNVETTVRIRQFPVPYYPIDYPFFGVNTAVSGVAYNIAKALSTLSDQVGLHSMVGTDFQAAYIKEELAASGIATDGLRLNLKETPSSVILYDGEGKRQVYCDLKDIQETAYGFDADMCRDFDLVVACNINFNRELLQQAKTAGKTIATDVHVLRQIDDEYNRDFMSYADILFLSDEGIGEDYSGFLRELARTYDNQIIVLGRGSKGAAMYLKEEGHIFEMGAVRVGDVVNTVGAGDALFSGFIHYYAKGLPALEALARSELFASAKIGASGGAKGFVGADRIEELYGQFGQDLLGTVKIL